MFFSQFFLLDRSTQNVYDLTEKFEIFIISFNHVNKIEMKMFFFNNYILL